MLLEDKVTLITGAASGIGAACTRLFIEEGASVILTDIDTTSGESLASELGDRACFMACDVSHEDQVIAAIAALVARHGRLDRAVNNAGITGTPASIDAIKLEDWQQVLNINLSSMFICLKHELKQMQRQSAGTGRRGRKDDPRERPLRALWHTRGNCTKRGLAVQRSRLVCQR